MSINPKYFNIIKTPTDNNCLFRSIVIFLNNQLLSCRRNRDGKPVNKQLSELEGNSTTFLRQTVVRMINSRKGKYSGEEFYDKCYYSSIEDRIEKMSQDGVFGGKLEMDIISRMFKIKIMVFIKFNEEYSSIYKSNLEEADTTENRLTRLLNTNYDEYNYSEGDTCFLLLENENYKVLEPEYIKINEDFSNTIMEVDDEPDVLVKNELPNDYFNENVTISISDRKLNCNNSLSNLSDSSFLNSSDNSFFNDDSGFEKIEISRTNTVVPFQEDTLLVDKLREFVENNSNAILINNSNGKNIFIEIKPNYKDICFNDLIDIINSIENTIA
jgi:hypothetical protein